MGAEIFLGQTNQILEIITDVPIVQSLIKSGAVYACVLLRGFQPF
jgi:hypothetical protein